MRTLLVAMALLLAFPSPTSAAPALADRDGSWVCLPDEQTAPQVLIDFTENIYRRCDQNTCSLYDIVVVRQEGEVVEISFAAHARLRADNAGGRYTETLKFGETTITSSGSCSFRGNEK